MKVLLIEDDKLDAKLVARILEDPTRERCELTHVRTLDTALERLNAEHWDVVVVDLGLPDASGSSAVKTLSSAHDDVPIVVLSGNGDEHFATEMIRIGAQDFIVKDFSSDSTLPRALNFAIERKATELRLRDLASYDPLTHLANRQEFRAQLGKACARADRNNDMAVLITLDLDGFKAINDLHGHQAGDELLCDVSRIIRRAIRKGDTAARLGGDEFAIILEGISNVDAVANWACDIGLALRNAHSTFKGARGVSASIGAALYPKDGRTVDELMQCADVAMYDVKHNGRNSFAFYVSTMDKCRRQRAELKEALCAGNLAAEIVVDYQPKVSLVDGALIGLEALARWRRPCGQLVQPEVFVPIAQRCGLIDEVGRAVLREVIRRQAHALAHDLPTVPISINADAQEIAQPAFAQSIIDALDGAGVPARLLRIEITETTLLEPTGPCLTNLQALVAAGVIIELDDFGAGHSTLNYLRQFPLETLKLDRSLVSDLACDPHSRLIVQTMIELGRRLGISVVAEGVEDAHQLKALIQIGCEAAQGFLISPPLCWDELNRWRSSYKPSFLSTSTAGTGDDEEDLEVRSLYPTGKLIAPELAAHRR